MAVVFMIAVPITIIVLLIVTKKGFVIPLLAGIGLLVGGIYMFLNAQDHLEGCIIFGIMSGIRASKLPAGTKFRPVCRTSVMPQAAQQAPQSYMPPAKHICPSCGAENKEGNNFCESCGAKLS